jgi:uracil-DNA glycosylase
VVEPEVMVCLGATAVRAVIGSKAKVMKNHGEFLDSKLGRTAMPTLHPSAILRADPEDRDDAMALLVGDLRRVRDRLAA